jgi:exopolysaccharide biosynthesis polyprenyl glycosylphosphotransferase
MSAAEIQPTPPDAPPGEAARRRAERGSGRPSPESHVIAPDPRPLTVSDHGAGLNQRPVESVPLASESGPPDDRPPFERLVASVDLRTLEIARARSTGSLRRRSWLMSRMLLLGDVVALALAFVVTQIATPLLTSTRAGAVEPWTELAVFLLTIPLWALLGVAYGLYGRDAVRTDHTTVDDLVPTFHLVTVGAWLVYAGSWLTKVASPTPTKIGVFWVSTILLVTAARTAVRHIGRRRVEYLQNTVIVGAGHVGQLVARKLLRHPEWGLNVVGFVDCKPKERHPDLHQLPVLGSPDSMPAIVRLLDVERVVIAFSGESHAETVMLVRRLADLHVHVDIVPRLFESVGPSGYVQTLEGLPIIGLPPLRFSSLSRFAKRTLDVAGAVCGLVVLAPLLLVIAAAIRIDSPGSPFYRQVRTGRNGEPFRLFKFRTMHLNFCRGTAFGGAAAEEEYARLMSDPTRVEELHRYGKVKCDPRITKVGSVLRRTSLDELPQLLNVVLGHLSLVGPRPIEPQEMRDYSGAEGDVPGLVREVTGYWEIPDLRPGVTGYWQINGRSDSGYAERARLDAAYVRNWSLRLDIEILAKTLRVLISTRGAY